jgi:hypothetical protein
MNERVNQAFQGQGISPQVKYKFRTSSRPAQTSTKLSRKSLAQSKVEQVHIQAIESILQSKEWEYRNRKSRVITRIEKIPFSKKIFIFKQKIYV